MIQVRHTLSAASLPSVTEFSEPISEADEIESVLHLQKLGDEAFHKKNFHQAVTFYSDALEIDEENAQLLSRRAIANSNLRNYKQAQRDAEVLVKFNPHVAKGHHLLAMCYEKLDKPKQAISSYLKAIQLDSKHQDKLTDRLGQVVSRLCKGTNLVANADKSLSAQLIEIGQTLSDARFPRSGVEVFQVIISSKTAERNEELQAHFSMGCCYLDSREYEKALDSFRQCLALALRYNHHGYTVRCYLRMARICFVIEEYEEGVVYAQKVISLCEDDHLAAEEDRKERLSKVSQEMQEWLVLAYRALGDMGSALEQAKQYFSTVDTNAQDLEITSKAHLLVGFLREGNGQLLEALGSYQDFLKCAKRNKDRGNMARGYGCIGRIYHKLNNLALAKSYYEQQMLMSEKLQYYTMLAPVLKNLADLHQDTGDCEATLKYLGMYLRISRKLDEFETECRAFLKFGDFYAKRGEDTLSYHYYEEAYKLAERSHLPEIKMASGLKLSRTLIERSDEASVSKVLPLIKAALDYFEEDARTKENEGGMASNENRAYVRECFELQQVALYVLKLPFQALEISENYRQRQLQEVQVKMSHLHLLSNHVNMKTKWSAELLKKVIETWSHPVLYLSVVKTGVLGWFMTPESGLAHHNYCQMGNDCHVDLIKSALSDLRKEELIEHNVECRGLPLENSGILQKAQKYSALSSNRNNPALAKDVEAMSEGCLTDSKETEFSKPIKLLYSLLLEPFQTYLSDCKVCTIVTDETLLQVPFDCLSVLNEENAGTARRISVVPCLQFLSLSTSNKQMNKQIKEHNTPTSQIKRTRVSGTSPVYLDQLLRVVVPPKDRPHQPIKPTVKEAPEMARNHPNPSFVAFGSSYYKQLLLERDVLREMEERYLDERMANGSTLITSSWSGTEVLSALEGAVQQYSPRSPTAHFLVMGNPKIPSEVMWHNKIWRPPPDMLAAQSEIHKIANQLSTQPITASHMTKDSVLTKLSAATIIHVASYGSWSDGVFICSPNPTGGDVSEGATHHDRCAITSDEIVQLKLIADLVVLNLGYGNKHRELAMKLPLAFLVAGAKCVLLPQWAICEAAQDKFWFHFYDSLHHGVHVTEAVRKAKLKIKEDTRFKHPRYWAGYCLLGNDPKINLMEMKSAVLDKHLNQMEGAVMKRLPRDALNIPKRSDREHSHGALIQGLCRHLSDLLLDHHGNRDVIPGLVSLMTGYHEFTKSRDSKPPIEKIPPSIASSRAALKLLSLIGFHFQASSGDPTDPPVALYPQWDPDRLMELTIQALRGIATVCDRADCSHALSKVLLESPAVHSNVIDLLAITKHMPEIQLKATDSGVTAVWGGNITRNLLVKLGFAEVGTLLMFKGNSTNWKLLSAVLQVLCAMCGDKGLAMMNRLDPQFLGVANRKVFSKSPSQSPIKSARLRPSSTLHNPAMQQPPPPPPPPKQLPSLNPVFVGDSKMGFSTSWKSLPEEESEVKEKMKVSKSLMAIRSDGRVNARVTDEWHALCSYPQALETLNSLGKPTVKLSKVKVHPGGSPSSQRVPLGYKPPLTLEAIEQRRDYAHYVLQERQKDVSRREAKAVRDVFLPYVKSPKVP